MARKPMVTRSFTTTVVNVLCMDVESAEPFNMEVTLPRTYKDNDKVLKKAQEVINSDTVKAVHIVGIKEVDTLYGMSEEDFIKNAKPLDPTTRKEIESLED